MARNVGFCYSSQGESGDSNEWRGWQRQRSPFPPAGVRAAGFPQLPPALAANPGRARPARRWSEQRAGSEQSEESFVSWRPPEHTVVPGRSREREEGGGRGSDVYGPRQPHEVSDHSAARCWDPARGKEVSSGNGKNSQWWIPLLWDREIALFRTCNLFLTWALGLARCCYWPYKRRTFPCSTAPVLHWAQDGLGRFLIPGMWLFMDPNPGNQMTWLTSTLRFTPCSSCTPGKEYQRSTETAQAHAWRYEDWGEITYFG